MFENYITKSLVCEYFFNNKLLLILQVYKTAKQVPKYLTNHHSENKVTSEIQPWNEQKMNEITRNASFPKYTALSRLDYWLYDTENRN